MASTFRVSASFLHGLKVLFPQAEAIAALSPKNSPESPIFRNPWYIVAAVAFSASNKPEAVPQVFEQALEDLRKSPSKTKADEKLLAQKFREALFKSGLTSGYPKAINGLKALHDIMPEDLMDKDYQRNHDTSLAEYEAAGYRLFRSFYGETSDDVQNLLHSIYPDMEWFSTTIAYGAVYGHTSILSQLETSYALIAALIAGDTPQQITWHLNNAQRSGASLSEVRAVRQIAIDVAKFSGVQWQRIIPEVEAVQE